MREIDLDRFAAAHAAGATVIDVREPFEYAAGHIAGARLLPLAQLPQLADDLASGAPVYVICASGNRSLAAADYLWMRGIDAWSVAGGTSAWRRSGRPVTQRTGSRVA